MPDVVMEYDLMENMTQIFNAAADQLHDAASALKMIDGQVQAGAIIGKGADKFTDMLENGLMPFTDQMEQKMTELAGDVDGARAFLQEGDTTAASKFK